MSERARERGGRRQRQRQEKKRRTEFDRDRTPLKHIDFGTSVCPMCNKEIDDITTALTDKRTLQPAHFDCVFNFLRESERLAEGEKLSYVGSGRFAVISYPNPRDTIHFKIERVIEWEMPDLQDSWRRKIVEKFDGEVIPDAVKYDVLR